jgi:L-asparaginase II
MSDILVVTTRGPLVETTHRVAVAVVGADGSRVAHAGDASMRTFWRSCAKPFQLFPLVADGGVAHFGLDSAMLALACASHNAEPVHREVGQRWLDAIGATEADLACGGHLSIWPVLANAMIHDDITATPLWSNCSGNHAALQALARLHGWPVAGYEQPTHPVQRRVIDTIVQWTKLPEAALQWGVDGCTATAVALPLEAMAQAYASLGAADDPSLATIRDAMLAWPYLIAGADRLDTVLMQAWPGRIIAKIGADGVYSAALPTLGFGLALKVQDGDMHSACLALVAVLLEIVQRLDPGGDWPLTAFDRWRTPPILNTRGGITGRSAVEGGLVWQ